MTGCITLTAEEKNAENLLVIRDGSQKFLTRLILAAKIAI